MQILLLFNQYFSYLINLLILKKEWDFYYYYRFLDSLDRGQMNHLGFTLFKIKLLSQVYVKYEINLILIVFLMRVVNFSFNFNFISFKILLIIVIIINYFIIIIKSFFIGIILGN